MFVSVFGVLLWGYYRNKGRASYDVSPHRAFVELFQVLVPRTVLQHCYNCDILGHADPGNH